MIEFNSLNLNPYEKRIGLIPAGGRATRVAPLPCSKELYPVGFQSIGRDGSYRPKVACHYLLEKMRLAGTNKAYIILRDGKWDIPAYLGDGKFVDMNLAYLMMDLPFGVPYTIDQAYAFVQDALIVFGFPDIVFQPDDVFIHLLNWQRSTKADVVLALFPADQPHKMDMVDLDGCGRIRDIIIKPARTNLKYTWIVAVWTPAFTCFLHEYLSSSTAGLSWKMHGHPAEQDELYMSDVIRAALHTGMSVDTVLFEEGSALDIGTPDNMMRAIQRTLRDLDEFP